MSVAPAAETLPVAAERPRLSEQERYYFASQWQLIWWRLRRHRFAMISLWFLVALYATIPFVEFLAPYELRSRHPNHIYSPPQRVHFFHEGRFEGPFVYGHLLTVNMENLRREYREDRTRSVPPPLLRARRALPHVGALAGRPAPDRRRGGRDPVPAGDRSPRAGHVLADHPRRPHLAHRGAPGHLGELRPGARVRRPVGLLRRDRGHRDPAVHRGHPRVPRAPALDGAVGRPAAPLGSDPRLRRHHRDPRGPRVDGPGPQRARASSWRCGRRTSPPPRCSWAARPPTSSAGTSCRPSRAT